MSPEELGKQCDELIAACDAFKGAVFGISVVTAEYVSLDDLPEDVRDRSESQSPTSTSGS